jgi:hypothetical protein
MLRIPLSVLDAADGATIGAPVAYPTVSKESGVYLVASPYPIPGHEFEVPMTSFERLKKYVDLDDARAAGEAVVEYMDEYHGLLDEAARNLGKVNNRIVREYVDAGVKDEALFNRLLDIRNEGIAAFEAEIKGIRIPRLRLKAIDAEIFESAVKEAGRINGLPEAARAAAWEKMPRQLYLASRDVAIKVSKPTVWPRLSRITTITMVADFVDPLATLATTSSYTEFKKAVADAAEKVAQWTVVEGAAVATSALARLATSQMAVRLVGAAAPRLLVLFTLTPPGWVVVGITVAVTVGAGIYFEKKYGEAFKSRVEKLMPELGLP